MFVDGTSLSHGVLAGNLQANQPDAILPHFMHTSSDVVSSGFGRDSMASV